MSQTVDEILQAALDLPDEEQLRLVAALLAAVDERGLNPLDDAWMAEIERRSDGYDAGEIGAVPWSVVKERSRRAAGDDG
jgi:putative addiction module component (TIGR02574 family)